MKALLGLRNLVTNVNLPNRGQLLGIPLGAVVETNAVFMRDRIVPMVAGKLPDDINALVLRNVYNQETTLKAGLLKDKELAFKAFANDPLVDLNIGEAKQLFNEMLRNTREYLEGWDC